MTPQASRNRSRWAHAAIAAGFIAVVVHGCHALFGLGGSGLDTFFAEWVYDALILLSAVLCLARAATVRSQRGAWLALGLGLTSGFLGELYWSLRLAGLKDPPYPSPSDVLYLGFYPGAYVALVLLARDRMRHFQASLWLDGIIGGLAIAAVGVAFVFAPVVEATDGNVAAVATTLAYPLGDILLISIVVTVLALTRWSMGPLVVLGIGLTLSAVADSIYVVQSAQGTYVDGTILDTLWPASNLLLASAAWMRPQRSADLRLDGWRVFVVPGVFSVLAIGLLAYGDSAHLAPAARILTYLTLAAIFLRAGLTFRENIRLLAASRRDALTDGLTGLHNRRSLMADLSDEMRRAEPGDERLLMLFDLDGFKQYNDTFGHPAGDALLERLGKRLSESVRPFGTAYRMGGDEFCVLVRSASEREHAVAAATTALSEHGEGFSISSSYGSVALPGDANDPAGALQLADQRMYAQKDDRRVSARRQTRDVLLSVLHERQPAVGDSHRLVTRHAVALGRALGLDGEELDVLARASELHDIGKIAIPDAILHKDGPLDPEEQAFMRRHPAIGDRILNAAPAMRPVARLVRASHERFDGTGYPDGLAGGRIPLGARIIAVADAFEALTSDRPYRPAVSDEEALKHLRMGAGTRFDPAIVSAFEVLLGAETDAAAA